MMSPIFIIIIFFCCCDGRCIVCVSKGWSDDGFYLVLIWMGFGSFGLRIDYKLYIAKDLIDICDFTADVS